MKKLLPACLLVLVPLISTSALAAPADVVQSVQQLMDRGNVDMALSIVDKAVVANPDDRPARLMRGVILAKVGRTNEAIDAFSAFARDYPTLPEGHNNLAVLYSNMGDYDKARIELESAIRANPNYAPGWENLAEVYLIMAGQSFSKSLQIDKRNSQMTSKISALTGMAGKAAAVPAKAPPMMTAQNCTTGISAKSSENPPPGAEQSAKPMRFEVLPSSPEPSTPVDPPAGGKVVLAPAIHDESAAVAAVKRWATLWSKKSVPEYLTMYSPDFRPPEGLSRQRWEKQRSARINKDDAISVSVEPITSVEPKNDGRIVVSFVQHYQSGAIDTRTQKRLTLVKQGNDWKIQDEERIELPAAKSL